MTPKPSNFGAGELSSAEDELDLLLDKRYRIIRLLGEGGMGSVHLAEHVGLNKRVAVKFLHLELAGQDAVVKRFEQEAKVAASIRHKNIIEVYDVGCSSDGDPFLVMEYLEGESLASLMKRTGPMDTGAACAVMEPALLALAAAHRQNIIHRDLKPDNIFLAHQPDEPPVVKVIDFGLSKITTSAPDVSCTQTGSIMGTPAYMSPEQARGASDVDHRTDLYSMGTMLFEMLTGELPYSGKTFTEFFAKLLTEEPRTPREVYPDFPVEAEPVVRKALSKSTEERFQSAAEMLEAIRALPGFDKREECLALLSSGMSKSTFAAGDLGPSGLPSARPRRRAFAAATGARAVEQLTETRPRGSKRIVIVGAVLIAVLAVVGAVLWGHKGTAPGQTAVEPALPAQPQAAKPPVAPTFSPPPPPVPAPLPVAAAPTEVRPAQPARLEPRPATQGKKSSSTSKGLRRGGRGTEMSEQFE